MTRESPFFREANRLFQLGLLPLPLKEGSKKPAIKGWQHIHRDRLEELFRGRGNIGLGMGELVAVDVDSKPRAREFFKEYRSVIRCIQESRRGAHFLFRSGGREIRNTQGSVMEGLTYDLRGKGGYIVHSPSEVEGHIYRYVQGYELIDPKRLEVIPDELIPKQQPPKIQIAAEVPSGDMYERALRWLKKREPAISGQQGHTKMIKTARALFAMFGMRGDQLWSLLVLYNQTCLPPFSEKELHHKFVDCQK